MLELEKDTLIHFKNFGAFNEFYQSLNLYHDWQIQTGTMNERGIQIANKNYGKKLKKLFADRLMFRRALSIAELTSFMDNFFFVSRLAKVLKEKLSEEQFNEIEIFKEYKILMSKNRRIDYLFKYKKAILAIEFRLSSDFPNTSGLWQKKELELIIYKELLRNYIPEDYTIRVYAFVGMPEYRQKVPIDKHLKYNQENIEYFAQYIQYFLVQDQDNRSKYLQ